MEISDYKHGALSEVLNWEEKTKMEVTEDFGGVLQFIEEKRYKVCKKCGKKSWKGTNL